MAPAAQKPPAGPEPDSPQSGRSPVQNSLTTTSEKSTVKVPKPSRLMEVLAQGGVSAKLPSREQEEGDGSWTMDTPQQEERSEMEALMECYGLASHQLTKELFPESAAVTEAAKERHGIWLFVLRLSSNRYFTWWCFFVILANSIFMGFQADAIAAHARGELDSLESYRTAESAFIGWFIVESLIRCLGSSVPVYKDRFLVFDIFVIALSAIELWILKPLNVLQGGLILSYFAVFRVLRLTRAVKLVRAMELFRSLYTMLLAVWQSKVTFLSVAMVLFTLIFVTALILMSLLGPVSGISRDELPPGVGERFESLHRCMVTLLETLLRGEEWGPNIVRPLLDSRESAFAGAVLILFAAFGQFFLLNLVSASFIEAMFKTVKVNSVTLEHEHIYVDRCGIDGMRNAFLQVGEGRKELSWKEVSTGLAMHPDVVMSLGINLELAEALFRQLIFDASDKVHIDEFIFGLVKLTRQSKTIDMLVLDFQQQRAQKDVAKLAHRFTVDMERLQLSTHKLARRLSATLNDCQPLRGALKARLKRQIERVHRNTLMSKNLSSEADIKEEEDLVNDAASRSSNDDASSGDTKPSSGPPPFLASWLEVLGREGRPRIRHELEASLGGLLGQDQSPSGESGRAGASFWSRERSGRSLLPDWMMPKS